MMIYTIFSKKVFRNNLLSNKILPNFYSDVNVEVLTFLISAKIRKKENL